MKPYSVMVWIIALNCAAFILNVAEVLPMGVQLYFSPFDVQNQFSLTVFAILTSGSVAITIVGALFRQYVYAAGALLIWVAGVMLPIAQWFLVGTPYILGVLIPAEYWYISATITAFMAFIFFIFFIEIVGQRQIT